MNLVSLTLDQLAALSLEELAALPLSADTVPVVPVLRTGGIRRMMTGGALQAPVPIAENEVEPEVYTLVRPRSLKRVAAGGRWQAPVPQVLTPATPLWPDPVGAWMPDETYFNGSNYLEVETSEIVENDRTVAVWVNRENSVSSERFMVVQGINFKYYALSVAANAYWNSFRNNSGTMSIIQTTDIYNGDINNWVHLAVRVSGNVATLWRNGVILKTYTGDAVTPYSLSTKWQLGCFRNQENNVKKGYFTGYMQHAMVWNQALTDDEIAALYAAGRG